MHGAQQGISGFPPGQPSIATTGFLAGLQLVWNSANSISAKPGAAEIEANGVILRAPSTITKASLSLSSSTWYYVYLYSNNGAADLDISTTAPGSAYSGSARSKSGVTSRRLIGFLRTDGSGNVLNFYQSGNQILYRTPSGNSPQRVLSAGSATSYTDVDCSAVIPANTQIGFFRFTNLSGGAQVARTKESEGTYGSDYFHAMEAGKQMTSPHPVNASRVMQYIIDASGSFYIDVMGYFLELT